VLHARAGSLHPVPAAGQRLRVYNDLQLQLGGQRWAGLRVLCSPQQRGTPEAWVRVSVGPDGAALAAAQQATQGGVLHLPVGRVPVHWLGQSRLQGAVRVELRNLPLELARRHIGSAVLAAGGYHGKVQVQREFAGCSDGTTAPDVGVVRVDVLPPADDPLLRKLPETFVVPGRREPVGIRVEGRTWGQPQRWEREAQQLKQGRQRAVVLRCALGLMVDDTPMPDAPAEQPGLPPDPFQQQQQRAGQQAQQGGGSQQQQRGRQRQQRQQRVEAAAADADVDMREAGQPWPSR
jgi:hypothetical protein